MAKLLCLAALLIIFSSDLFIKQASAKANAREFCYNKYCDYDEVFSLLYDL